MLGLITAVILSVIMLKIVIDDKKKNIKIYPIFWITFFLVVILAVFLITTGEMAIFRGSELIIYTLFMCLMGQIFFTYFQNKKGLNKEDTKTLNDFNSFIKKGFIKKFMLPIYVLIAALLTLAIFVIYEYFKK